MMKQVRFLAGIVLLAGAILYLLGGGWEQLGLDRIRMPDAQSISLPDGSQRGQLQANLEAAVNPLGVKVIHFRLNGNAGRVTLSWPMTSGNTLGMNAMNQARQRGAVRSFQPDGVNYIDERYEGNVRVYIARFITQF